MDSNKSNSLQLENLSLTWQDQMENVSESIKKQIIYFIKNPDPGSDFEKVIQQLPQNLPDEQLFWLLFSKWYGIKAKITPDQSNMVSFAAYQKYPEEELIKVFKFYTDEVYRWNKLSYNVLNSLLDDYKGFDLQIWKWPAEQSEGNHPHGASQRMVEIHWENWYNIDLEKFIIQNIKGK